MKKRALITGITGQDGSYLAELLLEKGYEVHGIVRRVALEDAEHRMWRIRHIQKELQLHPASLESYPSVHTVLKRVKPDECYHLAAVSYVSYSFEDEFSTLDTNINGTHYLLSALRDASPNSRFYFAASSEVFGRTSGSPQNELTAFHPRSAYGISKTAGFQLALNYREAYGMHASSGMLYNHESPRRGFEFVTRKITSHAAKISLGLEKELRLGNLDARRDWGHAKDYVQAMWLMLQQDQADDYVIASGESRTVGEFCDAAFKVLNLDYKKYVVTDPAFYRPSDIHTLVGDPSKAKQTLGWKPKYTFESLVREMVEHDVAALKGAPARSASSPAPQKPEVEVFVNEAMGRGKPVPAKA